MAGLRAAINAMCKQCIHDPIGGQGAWRQQVEACTSPECKLYPVRPKSTSSRLRGNDDNSPES